LNKKKVRLKKGEGHVGPEKREEGEVRKGAGPGEKKKNFKRSVETPLPAGGQGKGGWGGGATLPPRKEKDSGREKGSTHRGMSGEKRPFRSRRKTFITPKEQIRLRDERKGKKLFVRTRFYKNIAGKGGTKDRHHHRVVKEPGSQKSAAV